MKKALIIGHTGQDGSYLTEMLEGMRYDVAGISASNVRSPKSVMIGPANITSFGDASNLVREFLPDEVYYLAAVHQSSADKPIEDAELFRRSFDVNVTGLVNILDSIRLHSPSSRLFYAASSHVFGNPVEEVQTEDTPKQPTCIYGISKLAGVNACHYYRNTHNIFASVGIFYNHESPRRASKYVSKKIVEGAVAIRNKEKSELLLGSLDAKIDWGYAPDYIDASIRILQLETPEDFIISGGELHSVQEFVAGVFEYLDLDWKKYVKVNPAILTKTQKRNLCGNNQKLKSKTGWKPSVSFNELIHILVDSELKKKVLNS